MILPKCTLLAFDSISFFPEGDKKTLSVKAMHPSPERRTVAIAPIPGGVDIAQITSLFINLLL
jgi:hypothetical protein